MGITSSIIDVIAFIIFWYVLGYNSIEKASYFQTAWFITYIYLILLLVLYFTIVSIVKRIYIKKNHEWL